MTDSYQVIVADTAFIDIQQCLAFLARVSPKAAQELKTTIASLSTFPFRFEAVDMPKKLGFDFRKAVIEHRFLLVYAIKDNQVIVERLIDARQGFSTLL